MHPPSSRRLLWHVMLSLLAGGFLAAVDAYGMIDQLGPSPGWLFWALIMPLGWLQCLIGLMGVTALFGATRVPGVIILVLGAGLVALPIGLEVRLLVAALAPGLPETEPIGTTVAKAAAVSLFFGLVAWIAVERRPLGLPPCSWAMLGAGGPGADIDLDASLAHLAERLTRQGAHRPATTTRHAPPLPFTHDDPVPARPSRRPPPPPRTAATWPELRRMPEGLRGPILCLNSEDHYLRVHTRSGSGLILGRLSDAVADLGDEAGLQVHRSWWVAEGVVAGHRRSGRRTILCLVGDIEVPVSRAGLPLVRARGWLDSPALGSGPTRGGRSSPRPASGPTDGPSPSPSPPSPSPTASPSPASPA